MRKPGRPLPLEVVERRLKLIYKARNSNDVTDVAQHVASLEGVSKSTILWFAHKYRVSLRHKRNKSGRMMEVAPDDPSLQHRAEEVVKSLEAKNYVISMQHIEEEAARIARGEADICPACGYRYIPTAGVAASLGVCKVCYRESLELAVEDREAQLEAHRLANRRSQMDRRIREKEGGAPRLRNKRS